MLVTTEKIPTNETIENACPKCGGVGKLLCVPFGNHSPFETECEHCHGEKTITEDLRLRKNAATVLRSLMEENDLSRREAAQKFSQSFRDWIEAAQGRSSLEEIEAKIKLLEGLN